ncbi:serine/threonine-protein phosphatase CPPED1 [Anabrus simplex]|uniref:serine/threonine-protein phosphatase CPPED1 n=1 Tax=Anabrus simplex TaxID=316456 RepID=UPI0034DCE8A6
MSGDSRSPSVQEKEMHIIMTLRSWKILAKNRLFAPFDSESEKVWNGPFYFIQGADIQFGLIQRYIEKNPVPGWDQEVQLAQLCVKAINDMVPKPKFFVICGDLCDAIPTEEPEVFKKQEVAFKQAFGKLDPAVPLVCVCGNHDIGDHPTLESVRSYKSSFGDDYFSFWCGGVFFLVINSQYFFDTKAVQSLADDHNSWLEEQLQEIARSKPKRVIVFQHIPWFLKNAEERDLNRYFAIDYEIRQVMLEKLLRAGVSHVFCGHYHRNAGGFYKNMEVVVTSAIGGQLGSDEPGVRLVKIGEEKVEHTYYSLQSLPRTVKS